MNKSKDFEVHDSSYIDSDVCIGKGTIIWHFCHVMSGANIGDNCSLGQNVFIGRLVKIGSNTRIQNNVSVFEGVEIESNVFLGPSCVFTNDLNPRSGVNREPVSTLVKTGASIGANATIVCGNDIGRYAFIGAGSVVTNDIPDHALVVGNPSRIVGWVCHCGRKLLNNNQTIPTDLKCDYCSRSYRYSDRVITFID